MPEYVRAKDNETGHHVSVLKSQYERNKEAWTLLKQPATNAGGDPLPPKYKTTVSAETAKQGDRSPSPSKEK